jgi:hypothetical protein
MKTLVTDGVRAMPPSEVVGAALSSTSAREDPVGNLPSYGGAHGHADEHQDVSGSFQRLQLLL